MDQPEDDDLDSTLRQVTRRFPEQLARALLPPGTVITSARWVETQLATRQRRLDRALEVVTGDKTLVELAEWQLEMEADTAFRIYEYNTMMTLAIEAETPAGKERPYVQSTLVLLSGRDKPWDAYGTYRNSPPHEPFSGVCFRIEAVYQRTVAELMERGPLWAIFTPLAVDADPHRMKDVLARLRAELKERDFGEVASAIAAVSAKDKRQRGLRDAIMSMLKEEEVMSSWVYELGETRGELKTLSKLYAHHLGRALTEREQTVLRERLRTLGGDRLLTVTYELPDDALATWLADPAAH